jgi:hypothetical protein
MTTGSAFIPPLRAIQGTEVANPGALILMPTRAIVIARTLFDDFLIVLCDYIRPNTILGSWRVGYNLNLHQIGRSRLVVRRFYLHIPEQPRKRGCHRSINTGVANFTSISKRPHPPISLR